MNSYWKCWGKRLIFVYFFAATIEVKKNVYHMACNKWDTQIAVVENVGEYHTIQESYVRLYDVGRRRDTEDDAVRKFMKFPGKNVKKYLYFYFILF